MPYGDMLYGSDFYGIGINNEASSKHLIDLMKYLPDFYQNVKEMKELQTILGYEVGDVNQKTQEVFEQCFIATATWGLDRWEKVFGIETDKSIAYDRRREILMAKLRGSGIATREMIRNVAIAFSGGEVAIQEYPEEYRFVVQFIGVKGIPQNMTGLINSLDEIKPAHLAYSFKYTFTIWSQLSLDWETAKQKTWGDLRIYEGE